MLFVLVCERACGCVTGAVSFFLLTGTFVSLIFAVGMEVGSFYGGGGGGAGSNPCSFACSLSCFYFLFFSFFSNIV